VKRRGNQSQASVLPVDSPNKSTEYYTKLLLVFILWLASLGFVARRAESAGFTDFVDMFFAATPTSIARSKRDDGDAALAEDALDLAVGVETNVCEGRAEGANPHSEVGI